ncbi:dTDP-D-glucose 4,6-dehydratase-like protein [Thermothelomyces thermophilus ATCC 42464]|uniref:dTDP-D-glucose 4,6-dehydratase-like protein n=1 Tax=Thermothelomyces thermophilus (strain ATCC 42464 / BCRC 31852 / DSM 1799) TaxID=573729 RepID=G2QH38_THET4|nr:dTDP-D-glucose 4,6-dehydratase-like protein [Thermothelomyces thermophilus ATCC 42464]AEO58698.1 dTDP-D-glucose 4,6-dehydratase-like protein [Thermothelomyces thermophilus ATCC 42464]
MSPFPADLKTARSDDKFTPPDSPRWKERVSVESITLTSDDNDALKLIGTTRFEPRSDIKNILITGGAGFIGGWVTRHLVVQYPEYNVVCFDMQNYVSSTANVSCLGDFPNFTFVKGDITWQSAVDRVLAEHDIDCIMHFAAHSHVQNSFHDPASFTLNNVVGTQVLLDSARRHGRVRRFIHVSTDEVYGDIADECADENKQFLPTNPYSASKAAAEMYVYAYYKSFGIPVVIVRSNNVFGPGQYPEKIIPRFFTLLSKGQPLTIQGSGLNKRRYLYGADAADGFDTILHKGVVGEAYNVESESGVTNIEVAVRMLGLFGYTPHADFSTRLSWIPDRPFNDHDYRVDGTKLRRLGWRQKVSFEDGLAATVDWYRRNLKVWWPDEGSLDKIAVQTPAVIINDTGDANPLGAIDARDGVDLRKAIAA